MSPGDVIAHRALLRLYPRAFRQRFGAERLALFAQTAAAASC